MAEVATRWRWKPTLPALRASLLPPRQGRLRRLTYALLSIPLAAAYLALFASLVAAVVFAVQGVGVLLFLVVLAAARACAGLERRLARAMLDVEVEDGLRVRRQSGGLVRRLRSLITASSTWRSIAWLGARVLFGAGVAATVFFSVAVMVLAFGYPEWWGSGRHPVADLVVVAFLPVFALVMVRVVDLEVRLIGAIAPILLGVSSQERIEALRQTSLRLAERNTVARDLHDTIGHTLTASLLQATAARRTLASDPADPHRPIDTAFARQALKHIEDNTRAALAELDRALAVLGDGRTSSTSASELPAPGLGDIDGLAVGLRDGGLPLTVRITIPHERVPAELSQLTYRIIQEATTNVLRHAGCPPTLAEVTARDDWLHVRVRNDHGDRAESRPGPGGGHGIRGLRERVSALGGDLTAGRSAEGGFDLTATLPLREPR